MISVILPTYNEAENIKVIVPAISKIFEQEGLSGEVIIVDDNSPDGTARIAESMMDRYPLRVHVRKEDRGLSKAVIKGLELADGDICVVMDADMSHPVERVPDMIRPIVEDTCDMTVGSRYIPGGGSETWPLPRRIISRGAGFLARGVTSLSDPTSGFMALRKDIIQGAELDPTGWKIVLEVSVKTGARLREVPIVFRDRLEGESKLGFKAQMDYLRHLWSLYCHRFPNLAEFVKFCLVGVSGVFVDTLILIAFVTLLSLDPRFAAIFAFAGAVSWNYIFDRLWTFDSGRHTKVPHSYVIFVAICLIGLVIRIGIMHVLIEYAGMGTSPWYVVASLIGILVATVFNYIGSKYIVFAGFFRKA
jgi:dolichol-phosphate mannosyltransferase